MNEKNNITEKYRGKIDGIFYQRFGFHEGSELNESYVFVACDAGRIEDDKKYHKKYKAIKEIRGINVEFSVMANFYLSRFPSTSEITEKNIDTVIEEICKLNV